MFPAIAALLADPIWGPVIYAVLGIVVHKYAPLLDPLLNRLPGISPSPTPAPAGPSAPSQHPLLDQIARVVRAELASLLTPTPAMPAAPTPTPMVLSVPTSPAPTR